MIPWRTFSQLTPMLLEDARDDALALADEPQEQSVTQLCPRRRASIDVQLDHPLRARVLGGRRR